MKRGSVESWIKLMSRLQQNSIGGPVSGVAGDALHDEVEQQQWASNHGAQNTFAPLTKPLKCSHCLAPPEGSVPRREPTFHKTEWEGETTTNDLNCLGPIEYSKR